MDTEKIKSKQEFVVFLRKLCADYLENGKEWENATLERFLDAMIRYTEDIQGYYNNTNQNIDANKPSWKVFCGYSGRGIDLRMIDFSLHCIFGF